MRVETQPNQRRPRFLKERTKRGEMTGSKEKEAGKTIAGIINYHLDLLSLNYSELKRVFDATLDDPTVVRQHSRLGKKASQSLKGDSNSTDKNLIYDTFNIAFDAHQRLNHQERKFSGQPYIVHPMRVALISIKLAQALGVPVTPELIGAALTHDVIEDSPRHANGKGGRIYTLTNVESELGTIGRRGRKIAKHAHALSHHDVHVDGVVNEELYLQKIVDGSDNDLILRAIVKAADRIDNLLDPLPNNEILCRPKPNKKSAEEKMQDRGIVFANRLDILETPTSISNVLFNPPVGSYAEKVRTQRSKYVTETADPTGVIRRLFHDSSFAGRIFLRDALSDVLDISAQTVNDPYFNINELRQELADKAGVKSFDPLLIPDAKPGPEPILFSDEIRVFPIAPYESLSFRLMHRLHLPLREIHTGFTPEFEVPVEENIYNWIPDDEKVAA